MATGTVANAPLPALPSVERTRRDVNGVSLHVVAAGDPKDPLVVLLHGFPEFWYQWHDYIEPFVEAGYRVIVPDQRGYNRSERPAGVRPYRLGELSGDIVDLVGTEDRDAAHVVGHDWGAIVGWDLALRRPETVDRLGIINVPHPTVFRQVIRSNLTQLRKSWYVFYFQIPCLPQWGLRRNDYEFLVAAMRDGSKAGTFTETELDRYRRAWAGEGTAHPVNGFEPRRRSSGARTTRHSFQNWHRRVWPTARTATWSSFPTPLTGSHTSIPNAFPNCCWTTSTRS